MTTSMVKSNIFIRKRPKKKGSIKMKSMLRRKRMKNMTTRKRKKNMKTRKRKKRNPILP